MSKHEQAEAEAATTPIALIVIAWLVVVLPLGWGVYQSVVKSLPLFTGK